MKMFLMPKLLSSLLTTHYTPTHRDRERYLHRQAKQKDTRQACIFPPFSFLFCRYQKRDKHQTRMWGSGLEWQGVGGRCRCRLAGWTKARRRAADGCGKASKSNATSDNDHCPNKSRKNEQWEPTWPHMAIFWPFPLRAWSEYQYTYPYLYLAVLVSISVVSQAAMYGSVCYLIKRRKTIKTNNAATTNSDHKMCLCLKITAGQDHQVSWRPIGYPGISGVVREI